MADQLKASGPSEQWRRIEEFAEEHLKPAGFDSEGERYALAFHYLLADGVIDLDEFHPDELAALNKILADERERGASALGSFEDWQNADLSDHPDLQDPDRLRDLYDGHVRHQRDLASTHRRVAATLKHRGASDRGVRVRQGRATATRPREHRAKGSRLRRKDDDDPHIAAGAAS